MHRQHDVQDNLLYIALSEVGTSGIFPDAPRLKGLHKFNIGAPRNLFFRGPAKPIVPGPTQISADPERYYSLMLYLFVYVIFGCDHFNLCIVVKQIVKQIIENIKTK